MKRMLRQTMIILPGLRQGPAVLLLSFPARLSLSLFPGLTLIFTGQRDRFVARFNQ